MAAYYRVLHIKYESVAESPNGNQGEPFSLPLLVGFISCTCTLIGQARGTLYIKHIHFHGLLWLLRELSSIPFHSTYYQYQAQTQRHFYFLLSFLDSVVHAFIEPKCVFLFCCHNSTYHHHISYQRDYIRHRKKDVT